MRRSLPDPSVLYRSVFAAQLQNGDAGPTAFLLRERDEGELSVWLNPNAAWTRLQRVRRVLGLVTGDVRALNLGIVEDELDSDHALILNLPRPYESDEAFREAYRLAYLLLEMSKPTPQLEG